MYCGDKVTHVVCIVGIQLYVVCNVGDTVIHVVCIVGYIVIHVVCIEIYSYACSMYCEIQIYM